MVLSLDSARTALASAAARVTMISAETFKLSAARTDVNARMVALESAIREGDVTKLDALEAARDEHTAVERREATLSLARSGAERTADEARADLRAAEARAATPEVERLDAAQLSAWRAFCEAFNASRTYRRAHGHPIEGQIMTRALEEDALRAGLATPRLRSAQ
jgi:chromosome segregation ATPase